jgi:hypothetical protein
MIQHNNTSLLVIVARLLTQVNPFTGIACPVSPFDRTAAGV